MARVADIEVYGLNRLLSDLNRLPKEANDELKDASNDIATKLMVPYWKDAAGKAGEPWGSAIAGTVRAKRDRIPSVSIGSNKKVFTYGASPTAVRYPSSAGRRGRSGANGMAMGRAAKKKTLPATFFNGGTGWMEQMGGYKPQALKEWLKAVDRIKLKFHRRR